MGNEHDALVRQYLEKHFSAVGVVLAKEQVIVCCHLDYALFKFSFDAIQYYEANPYDIVNAIWEYINTYL